MILMHVALQQQKDIINTTMENPFLWCPVESFDRFPNQSD